MNNLTHFYFFDCKWKSLGMVREGGIYYYYCESFFLHELIWEWLIFVMALVIFFQDFGDFTGMEATLVNLTYFLSEGSFIDT